MNVIAIIYMVRAVFIRLINKCFLPATLISPRGLITILLYLSIAAEFRIPEINAGFLFLVVLISSFMMILGRTEPKH